MSDKDKLKDIKKQRIEDLQVKPDDVKELVRLLDLNYKTTVKSICKDFKTSRTWVNDYIRYNLPYIKILNSKGIYNNAIKKGAVPKHYNKKGDSYSIPFATYLELCYGLDVKEGLYFDTRKYKEYVLDNIREITRQTIRLPYYSLFKKEEYLKIVKGFKRKDIYKMYVDLRERETAITKKEGEAEYQRKEFSLRYSLKSEYEEYLLGSLNTCLKNIYDSRVSANFNRGSVSRVNIDLADSLKYREGLNSLSGIKDIEPLLLVEPLLSRMYTIRDIKDYGDTDEMIYRKLFRDGSIKVTFNFKNLEGVAPDKKYSKVYYLNAPKTFSYVEYPKYLDIDDLGLGLHFTLPYKIYLQHRGLIDSNLETYFYI